MGIMVGLRGEFAVGGRVQLPPGLVRSGQMLSVSIEPNVASNTIFIFLRVILPVIVPLILCLGVKIIVSRFVKSNLIREIIQWMTIIICILVIGVTIGPALKSIPSLFF